MVAASVVHVCVCTCDCAPLAAVRCSVCHKTLNDPFLLRPRRRCRRRRPFELFVCVFGFGFAGMGKFVRFDPTQAVSQQPALDRLYRWLLG